MADQRNPFTVSALLCLCVLQGCVTSQLPLLDENAAVADPLFAGHYTYTYSTTGTVDVYLKGKQFLVAENGKLRYIAVVNPWDAAKKTFIGQAREIGKAEYSYFLILQTDHGA